MRQFETLLARYECAKKTRPPAQPRFGSVCERLFGTTNTQYPALGVSPRTAFTEALAISGQRGQRCVMDDEEFRL